MVDDIKFTAALAGQSLSAKWLSISGEGDARLVLEVPASELPKMLRLTMLLGQSFEVSITGKGQKK